MNDKDLPYPERMQALTHTFTQLLSKYPTRRERIEQANEEFDRKNKNNVWVKLAMESSDTSD